MNFVTRKSFVAKLIVSIFLVIFLFNTISTNYSYGIDFGGTLCKPFFALAGICLIAINGVIGTILGGASNVYEALIKQTELDNPQFGNLLASPEHIFAGHYVILDANIFSADTDSSMIKDLDQGVGASMIGAIKKAVSGVYYVIRNTCGIALLCLLIYAGIRIVLASNSPQVQGKWKMYLIDWLKGLALVIFIHVLMIMIFYICDLIKEAFNQSISSDASIASICASNVVWKSWDFDTQLISLIMFGFVTYMTVVFTIAYFKRLVWTVMLIVIAPVVAVIYPINSSVYSGKDIFNKWLKEFTMNAMLPIFHTVIYYVLTILPLNIASASNNNIVSMSNLTISSTNNFVIAYALLSMSMIRPAEKFFRKLFDIHGEVADMGTYESGQKTMRAMEQGVQKAVKMVGGVSATVATGGAALAIASGFAGASGATEAVGSTGMAEGGIGAGLELGKEAGTKGVLELGDGVETEGELDVGSNEKLKSDNESEPNDEKDESERGSVIGLLTDIKTILEQSNTEYGESGENVENVEEGDKTQLKLKNNDEEDKSKNKGRMGRFLDARVKPAINTAKRVWANDDARNSIMDFINSGHELMDTMWTDPPPQAWKDNMFHRQVEESNKERQKNREIKMQQWVNNENNIQAMIQEKGLLEKNRKKFTNRYGYVNEAKALETAKTEAKDLLKQSMPFTDYGITNIGQLANLLSYQKANGTSTEKTIQGYARDLTHEKELTEGVEQFMVNNHEEIHINSGNKVKSFDMGGIKEGKRLNEEQLKAFNEAVKEIKDSAKVYEGAGNTRDKAIELAALERNMNHKEILKNLQKGTVKEDYVQGTYKAIEQLAKNNERAQINGSNESINKKALEDLLNSEIDKRLSYKN